VNLKQHALNSLGIEQGIEETKRNSEDSEMGLDVQNKNGTTVKKCPKIK